MTEDTIQKLADWRDRFERELDKRLVSDARAPRRLHQAIRYSVTNGGKRLRPLLVYATAELFSLSPGRVDPIAVALEMIHCYSLVHDDLPAMDNDDLRRGRPTTHRAFDDATAILVGDALQMQAFEILTSDPSLPADPAIRLELVRLLASAGGSLGMTGGQALDIAAEGTRPSIAELDQIHALKTGRLIRAGILMAAVAGRAEAHQLEPLSEFGDCIGLAFQIRDDLLDLEGDEQKLGKPKGSDLLLDKATYPAVIGVDASRKRLEALRDESLRHLARLGSGADTLRELALQLIDREY